MKKIVFFLLIIFSVSAFAQFEKADTLFVSAGAIDTTVYRVMKRTMMYLELDISTFSDLDTVDIGYNTDRTWLGSIPGSIVGGSSIEFPLVLDVSDWTKTVITSTGTHAKSRIGIVGESWPAKYIGFSIQCGAGGCSPSIHY